MGAALTLSAGNLLFKREFFAPKKRPPAALKAELIVESFNIMGSDGVNVGAYDLSLGIDYLLEKPQRWHYPVGFYMAGAGFVMIG